MGSVGDYWREAREDARAAQRRREMKEAGARVVRVTCPTCGKSWKELRFESDPIKCWACAKRAKEGR